MGEDEIVVNKDFIKQLCELAGNNSIDINNVTKEDLEGLLEAVKTKSSIMAAAPQDLIQNLSDAILNSESEESESSGGDSGFPEYDLSQYSSLEDGGEENQDQKLSVLIVDDLGVIVHQLSVAFEKLHMKVISAKEIFDALDKFKNQHFDLVIMDLFIPTDREGFMLLSEIRKVVELRKAKTKIAVITASSKKEYKKWCLTKGADFFFEKTTGWQEILTKTCFAGL